MFSSKVKSSISSITWLLAVTSTTGSWGIATGVSLAGDGERDLEKRLEVLRTMGDIVDLLLDDSGTSLTRDGRSSLLILLGCGSHSFVFSLFIVEVLDVTDEDSKDERIFEMDAVPPVTVGSAALGASTDDPSVESEWNKERAFLTTDGLPSTGLAIDNRLPLLFNGEHSADPSVGIVTDNLLGR